MNLLAPARPPGTLAVVPAAPPARLVLAQLVTSVVEGLALSSVVVHATLRLGLAPGTIGLVLAGAAAVAFALGVPLGAVCDRVGLRRSAATFGALTAAALLGYALAAGPVAFAVAATLFVVAQATAGSARQGLAVAEVPPAGRLAVRATMHTLLNAGLGAGAVAGAVLVAAGGATTFRTAYALAAVVSLLASASLLRLPERRASRDSTGAAPAAGLGVVLRDRRFAAATGLATLVQLTMPILAILLPVWVLRHTGAPSWTAGAALAVNTALVIVGQRPWTARLVDARSTVRSALLAAVALLAAGALLATSAGGLGAAAAAAVVVAAVVALTVGEVAGGAAIWRVALQHVPPAAEGRYQSAFSMSASAARVLGPLVALPLVLTTAPLGWLVLTVPMAAACVVVAVLAGSEPEDRR